MLSIFEYIDPSQYVSDQYLQKKEKNPAFSLRSFALQLGMKSHGTLHAILKGQRSIPKKLVPLLIKSFKLTGKEKKYFEILVDLQRSKTVEEREMYHKELELTSPKPLREIKDIEAYKYYTMPLHVIISEMVQLKGFRNTVVSIKNSLRMETTARDIQDCIERLIKFGLLKKEGSKLIRTVEHVYTSKDIMNQAVQEYHKKMALMGIESLTTQSLEEREFNGVSFNIKKKNIPKMKEELRGLVNDLINRYEEKPGEGEETYQLNVQLFSLTKSK